MKLVEQEARVLRVDDLAVIERAGRTCYKSEGRIEPGSKGPFVRKMIRLGHLAMLEHAGATVHLVTNRGVTHELVRHRLASFAQESTRYVRYHGEVQFIRPCWAGLDYRADMAFAEACGNAEAYYLGLLGMGWRPEQAREVLPMATRSEIVVTANYREWRHILALRALGTTGRPHPQIRLLMRATLRALHAWVPDVFQDLLDADLEQHASGGSHNGA